jgi:hypothetical protein
MIGCLVIGGMAMYVAAYLVDGWRAVALLLIGELFMLVMIDTTTKGDDE